MTEDKKDVTGRNSRSAETRASQTRGSNIGVIGVGGLILAKVPVETANERTAYFQNQAKSAMDGVDHNFMRESDGRMPIRDGDIQRSSKVAFGSKNANKGT